MNNNYQQECQRDAKGAPVARHVFAVARRHPETAVASGLEP
jgi:hypothetical protein